MSHYLAFDLGAESGRAMLGALAGGKLHIEELHRFPNTLVREDNGLYWDFDRLWNEIQAGIRIAVHDRAVQLAGIGVDTWGVDVGLIDQQGQILARPRHYRDPRNRQAMAKVLEVVPRDQVFDYTGIQFMQINSLYQVYAMRLSGDEALNRAHRLLHIPDLFNFRLTGVARSEATIASTSQFFNPRSMAWATELFKRLDLPGEILGPIVPAGSPLGNMLEPPNTKVYATAGHDTAAAVAAVPAMSNTDWCYISSGTWSLMGVEVEAPIINDRTLELNFTNEVGVAGRIRLLKNIAGLWLLQECRRAWSAAGNDYSYEQLAKMADEARPFSAAIDPDAFLDPDRMPDQIADFCRATGQTPPANHAEYARAILESLAMRYRNVLESLEKICGRPIPVIHIVGGGSRNMVLNRFVADCTGRRVIAGPGEATAIGNILVQAMGAGEIAGLDGIRTVVRSSFSPEVIDPRPNPEWDRAYERYLDVLSRGNGG